MVSAWDVYAEQMFPLGYGHPLWVPEPCLESGEVRIGDVGYLRAGGFRFMFNCMKNEDDAVNLRMGVPSGFAVFRPPEQMYVRRPNEIIQSQLHSAGLRSRSIGAGVGLSTSSAGPSANATLQYQFTESSGALLLLRGHGHYELLDSKLRIKQYMLEHFSRWSEFANDRLGIGLQDKEILFVSGHIKTAGWAEAAFRSRSSSGELSITGGFPPLTAISGEFSVSMSQCDSPALYYRSGPTPSESTSTDVLSNAFNQCVFLHYYKMKSRRIWPTIRAAAEPLDMPRHPGDEDRSPCLSDDEIECCVDDTQGYDPVGCLLDYILENSSAKFALASVLDLVHVFSAWGAVPTDVASALRVFSPTILLGKDGVGMVDRPSLGVDIPKIVYPNRLYPIHENIHHNGRRRSFDVLDNLQLSGARVNAPVRSPKKLRRFLPARIRQRDIVLFQAAVLSRYQENLDHPSMPLFWFLTPRNAVGLFQNFFQRINIHCSVLNEDTYSASYIICRCPTLFTLVCTLSSRCDPNSSSLYPMIVNEARRCTQFATYGDSMSVELAQAYILMCLYDGDGGGASEDQRQYIRIATRILKKSMRRPSARPKTESERVHETRLWLWCYILDRSTTIGFGKSPEIGEDSVIRDSADWYKCSPELNETFDIRIAAHVQLLRILSRYYDIMYPEEFSGGVSKDVNTASVVAEYIAILDRLKVEWENRFFQDADMKDPFVTFNFSLLLFLIDYSKLIVCSTALLQASIRPEVLALSVDQCYEYADAIVRAMVDVLSPSGYMTTSPNMFFHNATAAATFLVKSANGYDVTRQAHIIALLGRLVECYNSPQVMLDDEHTPALHARRLEGLVEELKHRHQRRIAGCGATTGYSQLITELQSLVVSEPCA